MKTSLLLLSTMLLFGGCAREGVQEKITLDQLTAVQQMQSSYLQAKAYNDSLINGHTAGLPATTMRRYDQMYHQADAAFTTCHHSYDHTYSSANHSHNSQAMVQMHSTGSSMMGSGGMMANGGCFCCTNGGHSADMHSQMEALHALHAQHHPQ